jgi:ribosomal protein L35
MSGRGKGKKSHETPSHLAERKTAEQLKRMAKAAHIPQSKDGQAFTKMQLARRIVAKKA